MSFFRQSLQCCGAAPEHLKPLSLSGNTFGSLNGSAAWIGGVYLAIALPLAFISPVMPPAIILASLILGSGLVALSAIDFLTLRLPDALTLPLAAAGLLLAPVLGLEPPLTWRLGAALGGYAFIWVLNETYRAVRGRAGLGLGDAKLLAVAGAWLGPEGLPSTVLYGSVGALLFVAAQYVRGHAVHRYDALPFGPFLAAAIWLVWLYGPLV